MLPRKMSAVLALAVAVVTAPVAASPSHAADFDPTDVVVEDPTTVTVMGLADSKIGDTMPVGELIENAEEVGQDIQDELLGAEPEESVAQSLCQFASPARSMDVRVVTSNVRLNDGAPRGVITAYREGPTVCPAWVREVAG